MHDIESNQLNALQTKHTNRQNRLLSQRYGTHEIKPHNNSTPTIDTIRVPLSESLGPLQKQISATPSNFAIGLSDILYNTGTQFSLRDHLDEQGFGVVTELGAWTIPKKEFYENKHPTAILFQQEGQHIQTPELIELKGPHFYGAHTPVLSKDESIYRLGNIAHTTSNAIEADNPVNETNFPFLAGAHQVRMDAIQQLWAAGTSALRYNADPDTYASSTQAIMTPMLTATLARCIDEFRNISMGHPTETIPIEDIQIVAEHARTAHPDFRVQYPEHPNWLELLALGQRTADMHPEIQTIAGIETSGILPALSIHRAFAQRGKELNFIRIPFSRNAGTYEDPNRLTDAIYAGNNMPNHLGAILVVDSNAGTGRTMEQSLLAIDKLPGNIKAIVLGQIASRSWLSSRRLPDDSMFNYGSISPFTSTSVQTTSKTGTPTAARAFGFRVTQTKSKY